MGGDACKFTHGGAADYYVSGLPPMPRPTKARALVDVAGLNDVVQTEAQVSQPDAASFIKRGAALSMKFKKAWSAYARHQGLASSDPSKCEEEFLRGFADWLADLVNAGLSDGFEGLGGEPEPQNKRQAVAQPHGLPASKKMKYNIPDSVQDEIQRLNDEGPLPASISLALVAGPLSELEESVALNLVQQAVDVGPPDPTAYICDEARELLAT